MFFQSICRCKQTRLLLTISLMLLLGSGFTACSKPPAEQAIRSILKNVEIAIEEKNTGDIMRYLAPDFLANGYMDKKQLRQYITSLFVANNNIQLIVTSLEINHNEQNPFYAAMNAVVAVTGADRLIPDEARLITVNGDWSNHDGDWLLTNIEWQ